MQLSRGQKIALNENFLTIKFERQTTALEIDVAAFLRQANGKVSSDADFIFYGNTNHVSGAVIHKQDDSIDINLDKIPRNIEKISITATIYEADKRKQNFVMIRGAILKIIGINGEITTFPLENFSVETAIVLGEVYRYRGSWKFNAIGAGYSGGLAALCNNFGIEVKDITPIESDSEKTPSITRHNENVNQAKKIELKKGQIVNLIQHSSSLGEITINLNLEKSTLDSKFNRSRRQRTHLDLACLFELDDGSIGSIQALGNYFGSFNYPPYIALDTNSDTISNVETIRINGRYAKNIRRILIYTFIYEGTANWEEARGIIKINCKDNPELIVKMDEYDSNKNTCAIALIENVGDNWNVEKIMKFFDDSEQMDRAFDWGLRWTVGYKN